MRRLAAMAIGYGHGLCIWTIESGAFDFSEYEGYRTLSVTLAIAIANGHSHS